MSPTSPICLRHRDAGVVAVCRRCSEGMCDACWQHVRNDAPLCPACAFELQSKGARAGSIALSSVLAAGALALFASRHGSSQLAAGTAIGAVLGALVVVLVVAARWRGAAAGADGIRRREPDDALVPEPLAPGDNPYRVRFARVASRALPRLSGRATAGVMAIAFVATASLVPFALHLPRWEKTEVVLGAWWLIGAATLAWLLHRGARLADDHALRLPWSMRADTPDAGTREGAPARGGGSSSWGDLGTSCADPSGCVDGGEGCAGIVIGLVLAAVAFAASWLLVELVAPLVFFLFYLVALRAIARVTRDRRDCAGRLGRSLLWGALWSAVYLAPIACAVLGVHELERHHASAPEQTAPTNSQDWD